MGKVTHLATRENLSRHLIEQWRQEPAPTRRSIATGHGDAQAAPAGASGAFADPDVEHEQAHGGPCGRAAEG